MTRLAWFSPMPPVRSGVAMVSADLVPALRAWYDIDVFVDSAADHPAGSHLRSAHDFVWLNRRTPYDLTVYQLGNSAVHEYMWAYLFRYPGLTVLHDARVHHARAAALLRARRTDDYRAEFAANHPAAHPDLAELAVAGFDNHLYYHWPMTRLVAERSRLTAVHAEALAARLRLDAPRASVESIRLGHGRLPDDEGARTSVRARYGIEEDAVVFGCFGGLSPEKRLPQILRAFAALRDRTPPVRLLLGGATPGHYDLQADIERAGAGGSTIVAGYLDTDAELNACISACDVALNLRWPTAWEISGPWLRCLAAGVPTIITQLGHLSDVPSIDPRTWRPSMAMDEATADGNWKLEAGDSKLEAGGWKLEPVCLAIDILDEDHSLRLAMRRLARDGALRRGLGGAGRRWWEARHAPAIMIQDYRRILEMALELPAPEVSLPPHLLDDGRRTLERLLEPFRLPEQLR